MNKHLSTLTQATLTKLSESHTQKDVKIGEKLVGKKHVEAEEGSMKKSNGPENSQNTLYI